MKKTCNFSIIFDYILVILLIVLSLSKGGFYKSDILIVSIGISIIAFLYTLFNLFKLLILDIALSELVVESFNLFLEIFKFSKFVNVFNGEMSLIEHP